MDDHFERLGIPRRFSINAEELERAYLARSRAIHPDYHLAGSNAELTASLELSAELNEAYATLRDPFRRAAYLLKLEGGLSAKEQKQLPSAFLAEMLEARERIEEARIGCPDEAAVLAAEFEKRYDGLLAEVQRDFDRLAQLPPSNPERDSILAHLRGILNAAKYVRGLMRDLHAE